MKESTRQQLLSKIGHRKSNGKAVVYVPTAVCAVAGRNRDGASIAEAIKLGATNFRAVDGQIVADWPKFAFAVADYLDREFAAKGFDFRPDAWFCAAKASGIAGHIVQPSIPDRSEFHPTSLLVNLGIAEWSAQ